MICFTHEQENCPNPDCRSMKLGDTGCMRPRCVRDREDLATKLAVERNTTSRLREQLLEERRLLSALKTTLENSEATTLQANEKIRELIADSDGEHQSLGWSKKK